MGRGLELFYDGGFQVVGFDDAIAGEGFVHQVRELSIVCLHRAGGFADLASINNDWHDAHRENHDGHQRQRGLEDQQDDERAKDGYRVFDGGSKRTADDAVKHLRVVGDTCDQIASAGAVEKSQRKILQVTEQFCADIGDGVHGRPVRQINTQVGQCVAEQYDDGNGARHQRPAQLRGGGGQFRRHRDQPVREGMNPVRCLRQMFGELFVEIGRAGEN